MVSGCKCRRHGSVSYTHLDVYKRQDTAWSKAIEVVTVPEQVVSNSVKQTGAGTTSISLSWQAASGANCYKLTCYQSGTSENNASEIVSKKNSVKITGLKKNSRYQGHIYAGRTSSTGYTAYATSGGYYSNSAVTPTKITGVELSLIHI